MPQTTYYPYENRPVLEPDGFGEAVYRTLSTLSLACRKGVLMLDEELEAHDPDPDERCGLLADRHEVFALRIPDCKAHRLIVSIDRGGAQPPPATLHGAVSALGAYKTARTLVSHQLNLIDPTWE